MAFSFRCSSVIGLLADPIAMTFTSVLLLLEIAANEPTLCATPHDRDVNDIFNVIYAKGYRQRSLTEFTYCQYLAFNLQVDRVPRKLVRWGGT